MRRAGDKSVRPSDPNCIFCRIVREEIPACTVYRNDGFVAFLDINPVSRGHTLLIPTAHIPSLAQADPVWLGGLAEVLPLLCRAVMTATAADGLNLLANTGRSAGQVVDHVHFHLIPRKSTDPLKLLNWKPTGVAQEDLEKLQRAITEALG